jgi:hypothetical protein
MKDPTDNIRQWIYGVLYGTVWYGGVSIPVYSFPPKDVAMPYIVIAEQSMNAENGTKDCYITENEVQIEIYSAHAGNDASYKTVTSIANDVLKLLIQRSQETHGSGGSTVGVISGFNTIEISLAGSVTDRFLFETNIVIFKSLNIKLILEES